jgi:hypothetical protein
MAIVLSALVAGLACGRLGFESAGGDASSSGPFDGAFVDDGGVIGPIDGGVAGPIDASAPGDGSGAAIQCPYMNCPMNESTCCMDMAVFCAPTGSCPGVETECDVDGGGQGCPAGPAQSCCPSADGGAFCTPALCTR